MISDEDHVRILLRSSYVPTTRLEPDQLLARGRRSRRRWRRATVAAAVIAVLAVSIPAVTLAARPDGRHDAAAQPTDVATTVRVVHRTTKPAADLRCDQTPLASESIGITGVDPTGAHVIGGATVWADGVPEQITVAGATAEIAAAAVNVVGTVVGHDGNETGLVWRRTAAGMEKLANPPGWARALALHVNAGDDALGVVSTPDRGVDTNIPDTALVVWPAGRPDAPRIVPVYDAEPLAIRDDGTVIAARARSATDLGAGQIVARRPDGRTVTVTVPKELTTRGSMLGLTVSGDYLYGARAAGELTYSDGSTPIDYPFHNPVRWNLRTGLIEIFDDLHTMPAGDAGGWFAAAATAPGGPAAVLVTPAATAHRIPDGGATVRAVAAEGTILAGDRPAGPVLWRCARP